MAVNVPRLDYLESTERRLPTASLLILASGSIISTQSERKAKMTKHRAHHEGTVYQRPDGRWCAQAIFRILSAIPQYIEPIRAIAQHLVSLANFKVATAG